MDHQPTHLPDLDPNDRDHDRLARRLSDILFRFNQGEQLEIDELAGEYGVHRRTIQRDLTERFRFLPIEKVGNRYQLQASFLGKLGYKDIARFAALAGLQGLFPSLDTQFIRELFDSRLSDALDVHGNSHEDLRNRLDDFRTVQRAVAQHRRLQFFYTKDDVTKQVEADPYRLVNNSGVWYLVAIQDGKPKSYAFGKLKVLQMLEATFTPDPAIIEMINEEDSIWLNVRKTEVVLNIAAPAAVYFRRRKLISRQQTVKELEDGGLLASGQFAHPNQILPIVRYWLPHVRIVSPAAWQEELELGLRSYLAPKGPSAQGKQA